MEKVYMNQKGQYYLSADGPPTSLNDMCIVTPHPAVIELLRETGLPLDKDIVEETFYKWRMNGGSFK